MNKITTEEIIEIIELLNKCETKTDFRERHPELGSIVRYTEELDEIYRSLRQRRNSYTEWTEDEVLQHVNKNIKKYSELNGIPGLKRRIVALGIIDKVKEMLPRPKVHNKMEDEELFKIALKYDWHHDFREYDSSAYTMLLRRKLYTEATKHMKRKPRKGSNDISNIIYLWEVVEVPGVYKIGITSGSRHHARIKNVTKSNNISSDIIRFVDVGDARIIENKLKNIGETYNGFKGDGKTEFRIYDTWSLNAALDIIDEAVLTITT